MAIALVKYDLSNEDDKMDYKRANASLNMACFIFEVLINGKKKFRDCDDADKIWEYLWETAKDNGVEIDNLIQ
jgi:DNA-binding sugar fermentation-stimulating protein